MTRPRRPSLAILVPAVLVMMVFPHSLTLNMDGARSLYHSFLEKGSTAFFLPPFLDLVRRLFFPCYYSKARDDRKHCGQMMMNMIFLHWRPFIRERQIQCCRLVMRWSNVSHNRSLYPQRTTAHLRAPATPTPINSQQKLSDIFVFLPCHLHGSCRRLAL